MAARASNTCPSPGAPRLTRLCASQNPPPRQSISAKDRINPAAMGEWVAGCFAPSAELLRHESGHVVPSDAASVETVRAFVERHRERDAARE